MPLPLGAKKFHALASHGEPKPCFQCLLQFSFGDNEGGMYRHPHFKWMIERYGIVEGEATRSPNLSTSTQKSGMID